MVDIRKGTATKNPFADLITVLRLHLMRYIEVLTFIQVIPKAIEMNNDTLDVRSENSHDPYP